MTSCRNLPSSEHATPFRQDAHSEHWPRMLTLPCTRQPTPHHTDVHLQKVTLWSDGAAGNRRQKLQHSVKGSNSKTLGLLLGGKEAHSGSRLMIWLKGRQLWLPHPPVCTLSETCTGVLSRCDPYRATISISTKTILFHLWEYYEGNFISKQRIKDWRSTSLENSNHIPWLTEQIKTEQQKQTPLWTFMNIRGIYMPCWGRN